MFPIIFGQIKSDEDRIFFEELYKEKHASILRKLKQQIFNQDDAEEVEQDVWRRLIEKTDTLRKLKPYELNQYVVKVVRSVRIDYIRRQNKADILGLDEEVEKMLNKMSPRDVVEVLEEKMAYEQLLEELPSLVLKLTATEQLIYHYKFEMKESDQQLAERLHISVVSVRKYISRTKRSLFKLVQEWTK